MPPRHNRGSRAAMRQRDRAPRIQSAGHADRDHAQHDAGRRRPATAGSGREHHGEQTHLPQRPSLPAKEAQPVARRSVLGARRRRVRRPRSRRRGCAQANGRRNPRARERAQRDSRASRGRPAPVRPRRVPAKPNRRDEQRPREHWISTPASASVEAALGAAKRMSAATSSATSRELAAPRPR